MSCILVLLGSVSAIFFNDGQSLINRLLSGGTSDTNNDDGGILEGLFDNDGLGVGGLGLGTGGGTGGRNGGGNGGGSLLNLLFGGNGGNDYYDGDYYDGDYYDGDYYDDDYHNGDDNRNTKDRHHRRRDDHHKRKDDRHRRDKKRRDNHNGGHRNR